MRLVTSVADPDRIMLTDPDPKHFFIEWINQQGHPYSDPKKIVPEPQNCFRRDENTMVLILVTYWLDKFVNFFVPIKKMARWPTRKHWM